MRPMIAYRDYVQNATALVDSLGGTYGSKTPLSNLKDMRLSKKAVSTTSSSPEILASFSTDVPVQCLALLSHGYADTTGSLQHIRWRGYNAAMAVVFSETLTFVWRPAYGTQFTVNHVHILSQEYDVRHIECKPVCVGSNPKFSAGRLWAGPIWEPPQGIEFNWTASLEDPGSMSLSRGGQGYPKLRQRIRSGSMTIGALPFATAYGEEEAYSPGGIALVTDLQSLGYEIGTTSPAIIMPRTHLANGDLDNQAIHRVGMYGHLTRPLSIQHAKGNFFRSTLEYRELL